MWKSEIYHLNIVIILSENLNSTITNTVIPRVVSSEVNGSSTLKRKEMGENDFVFIRQSSSIESLGNEP